jgi:hypothetical protein
MIEALRGIPLPKGSSSKTTRTTMKSIAYNQGQVLGKHGVRYLEEAEPVFYKRKQQGFDGFSGNPLRVRRALFLCGECENEFCAHISNVRQGYTKSCGCKKLTADGISRLPFGKENPIHSVWVHIINRCCNPADKAFKYYGARGISVCEEWQKSFKTFYDWAINNEYEQGLQIDRRDNNGNYEPGNCRFVTRQINCRNRRSTRYCWLNGEKMCHSEAAKRLGKCHATISAWSQGKYPSRVPLNLVFEEPS